ncbi:MAG: DUF5678 domain-containing protein [Anaerolineae bacterium]
MVRKIDRARFPHMRPDDLWIVEHFEELINQYAGKYVAVVGERVVSVGPSGVDVEKEAKAMYPDSIPSVLLVPRPEHLRCLL